jgi:Trypsin
VKNSIFSLSLISGLLVGTAAGAVVGGQAAFPGDSIRLSVVELSGPGCTGISLGSRYVLTAAHCTGELPSLVIFKSSLYQGCSHSFVDDVYYPPDEKLVAINGQNWPVPDLAVLRLQTPLCGTTPVILSSEPLTPGTILRTAGYSEGLWDAREVDWTDVRILPSDAEFLIRLFPDFKSTARRLRQMIQTEVSIFSFARPVKDGEAICQGDSGGPVYKEIGGQVSIYGVTSGVLLHPKIGGTKCDGSLIQLIVPIQPERNWILSKVAGLRF